MRSAGTHKDVTLGEHHARLVISTGQFFLDSIGFSSVGLGFDSRDTRG